MPGVPITVFGPITSVVPAAVLLFVIVKSLRNSRLPVAMLARLMRLNTRDRGVHGDRRYAAQGLGRTGGERVISRGIAKEERLGHHAQGDVDRADLVAGEVDGRRRRVWRTGGRPVVGVVPGAGERQTGPGGLGGGRPEAD